MFQQPKKCFFYLIVCYAVLTVPCLLWFYEWGGFFSLCFYLVLNLDTLRLCFKGVRHRRPGAWILFSTTLLFYVFFTSFVVLNAFDQVQASSLLSFISLFMPPFGLLLFLAGEFARTNLSLAAKLTEVEILSAEKQQILSVQNETLEHQVAKRTSELNQSLETLKSTQAQLIQSEKMASLGELTAGIAHEIQNPLNFVNNYAEVNMELLGELKTEGEKRSDGSEVGESGSRGRDERLVQELIADLSENEAKILHHGQRANAIVRGMLQHSRSSSGPREPTNLNALADEYLRLAYHGLRAKDNQFQAELITDFDKSMPRVEVVPQDMGRVLLNIINNAFQAVAERSLLEVAGYVPKVTVTTKRLPTAVEVRIADNGNGIPEAIKEKIFQPFFTTKPTGSGTGLGLSLAYDIVKVHGGTLKVESAMGEGSIFVIIIPVVG